MVLSSFSAGPLRSVNLEAKVSSETVSLPSSSVSFGWAAEQGLREEMEDEISVVENKSEEFTFVGVFDGHAGNYTARFLKEELYSECLRELEDGRLLNASGSDSEVQIKQRLSRAFKNLDDKLLLWQADQEDENLKYSGSTATSLFVTKKRIIVANAGDCRAVLSSSGTAIDLCNDHRPFGDSPGSRSEVERIKAAGGWIAKGRVCGYLAVSRAFGDLMYKNYREHLLADGLKKGKWTKRFVQKLSLEEDWVTALPEVSCRDRESGDEFILVGSDGLWDSVSSTEAVVFVRRKLSEGLEIESVCNSLINFALGERKGDDNTSVVLVKLS